MSRLRQALAIAGAWVILGGALASVIEAVGDPNSVLAGVALGLSAAIAGAVAARTMPPPAARHPRWR